MTSFRSPRRVLAAFAGLVLFSTAALAALVAPDLTGTWNFSVVTENGTGTPVVTLKQEGERLTGTYDSPRLGVRSLAGTVKGDSLHFTLSTSGDADAALLSFAGIVVDADHLKGDVDFGGMGGATFTATRRK